jgi:hypothetical protein
LAGINRRWSGLKSWVPQGACGLDARPPEINIVNK